MEICREDLVLLCGRMFTQQELEDIRETVRLCWNLSVEELAQTLCEHLDWKTPLGRPKRDSALELLRKLATKGSITLPPKQPYRRSSVKIEAKVECAETPTVMKCSLAELLPIELEPVSGSMANQLWNGEVNRYHCLGYKRPFGAHQRYYIISHGKGGARLGCLMFSAAAWALTVRDEWIGWNPVQRSQRLNWIVNNSRFLIFPWVQVKNLASKALSLAAERLRSDWKIRYGYAPVLLETFVDGSMYRGTCYQAANWLYLGETAGRGRMDRHKEYPSTPKQIYVDPLVKEFREYLCHEEGWANE